MVSEEIELDLGLSIGGSFGKPEKLKPVKKVCTPTFDSESNGSEVDVPENRPALAGVGDLVDPQVKREMHALRRRQAKRKREEKQETKRSTCRAKNGKYGGEWAAEEEQGRKLDGTDEQVQMQWRHCDGVNGAPFQAVAATVHYPYAPVQYVPFTNGGLRGFPCVMPCWVPGGGAFKESAWRGFRPYKTNQSTGLNLSNGETASYGSTMCGSSAGSEDPSSSHEGGGSVDSRSRSSHSLPSRSQSNGHKANGTKGHPENSASPEPVESDHGNNDVSDHTGKVVCEATSIAQPRPATPKEEAVPTTGAQPSDKPVPNTSNSSPDPGKETKRDMRKPPKPQTQNQNTPLLPQMPYVSTTGDGPNGKTVTGFLYRYTKSEVSIVCVCHGSTFSPAEFVQHAGGTDVSHPLRHIRVIPSAFG